MNNIKRTTKAVLLGLAKDLGIQLPEKVTKAQIVSAIEAEQAKPDLPSPPTEPTPEEQPETDETKPDLPVESEPEPTPEAKVYCKCCNELVDESLLRICPKCSFEGCMICRKSGNCPTCGTKMR